MSYATAEITITQLSNGKIIVNHSDGSILLEWNARVEDWDAIWHTLDTLKENEVKYEDRPQKNTKASKTLVGPCSWFINVYF